MGDSAYFLGCALVSAHLDNWGIESMRNILTRIKGAQHVINAIEDELLLSQNEFEKRWQHYVLEKYLKQARSGVVLEGTGGIANGEE